MVMESKHLMSYVILMAPVCGPWSNMQHIQQDQHKVWEKQRCYIPMLEFVASIARYQLKHGRYFMKISDIPDLVLCTACSNCYQIHP